MALLKCHECGHEVSSEAAACPQCGAKPRKPPEGIGPIQFVGIGILALIGIGAVAAIFSDDSPASKAPSEATCRQDLQCWGDRNALASDSACAAQVEKLALHSVRWKTDSYEPKFQRFRWKDKDVGTLTYVGDRAEFQNGFGAYTPVVYECDFDPSTKTVLDVRAEEGRLP